MSGRLYVELARVFSTNMAEIEVVTESLEADDRLIISFGEVIDPRPRCSEDG